MDRRLESGEDRPDQRVYERQDHHPPERSPAPESVGHGIHPIGIHSLDSTEARAGKITIPGMRNIRIAAALAPALLLTAACSSVSVSSERLIGAPSFPPTDPASVMILRREPRQPHDRVGEVFLEPSGNPPIEEMERCIRDAGYEVRRRRQDYSIIGEPTTVAA